MTPQLQQKTSLLVREGGKKKMHINSKMQGHLCKHLFENKVDDHATMHVSEV